MFKKKQSLLVSRPRPPSFSEVIEDINGADEDDVVFAFSDSLTENSAATGEKDSSKSMHEESSCSSDDTSENEQLMPAVDTVYHQVHEFMRKMEDLKSMPEKLQALYEHLRSANHNLQESIEQLRHKAEDLQTFGSDFNEIGSK